MLGTAITANPLPYSKARDTSRPPRRQRAARGADLGGKRFAHFLVRCSVRNRFVAEHVSEGRPARIVDGLGHAGLGKSRRIHIPNGDVVELSHDATRELMQEISALVCDPGVDIGSLPLFSGAQGNGKSVLQRSKVARVFYLLARRECREVFQAEVNANAACGRSCRNVRYLNTDVQEPVTASIACKVAAIDELCASRQVAALEDLELATVEMKTARCLSQASAADRNPWQVLASPVAKVRALPGSPRLDISTADGAESVGMDSKLLRAAGSQFRQIKERQPFSAKPDRVLLPIVAVVPDEVDCASLAVEQAEVVLNAVSIDQKHSAFYRAPAKGDGK